MKIGIFTPYLRAFGGGEKYICKIAEVLSHHHFVEFIILEDINKNELENRLNINLEKISFKKINLRKLKDISLFKNLAIGNISKNYDIFINQENNTTIFAKSKKNFHICQQPILKLDKSFFQKLTEPFFSDSNLESYQKIIVYSQFIKKEIEKQVKNEIKVIYPPIEDFKPFKKENIILSVGRFFVGFHNKKQLEMIKIFKELYDENIVLNNWEYHLVGGIVKDTRDIHYLETCQKEAKGYPIYIHTDVSFVTLKELYGKSKIFWHATGLNEDENDHPELMEHFGITTGEAMSAGCVPVVINKGGQPEIVREKVDGFLWNTPDQLKDYTLELVENDLLWENMSLTSTTRAKKFGMENFIADIKELFISDTD